MRNPRPRVQGGGGGRDRRAVSTPEAGRDPHRSGPGPAVIEAARSRFVVAANGGYVRTRGDLHGVIARRRSWQVEAAIDVPLEVLLGQHVETALLRQPVHLGLELPVAAPAEVSEAEHEEGHEETAEDELHDPGRPQRRLQGRVVL